MSSHAPFDGIVGQRVEGEPVIENSEEFRVLCDTVALIYHEGRNVRHLLSKDLLNPEPWRFVVSLPTKRDDAWREIAPLRDKAQQTETVDGALKVFEHRFHVSLIELVSLFENENWSHARDYAGNAWAGISKLAAQLAEALRKNDMDAAYKIATQLKGSRHNTGSVQEKLVQLEKALESRDA